MKRPFILLFLLLLLSTTWGARPPAAHSQTSPPTPHLVQPGDTWTALAARYGVDASTLQAMPPMNRQRQPVIGTTLSLPAGVAERMGKLARTGGGGLLQTAVRTQTSPWSLVLGNDLRHPYRPSFYAPLFIPGGSEPPRDLPPGFHSLELSQIPARPGQALAFRAQSSRPLTITATLANQPVATFQNGRYLLGLTGTGAFFGKGAPDFTIEVDHTYLWSQPWLFVDNTWEFQQLTLTGEAAEIDQQSIEEERRRLFQIWSQITPQPQWRAPFTLPISDYLGISSRYGARRSYNGGPYRTYHEGVDFSAYGGTPVYAPAAGTVALAETLYVRGGAVILDHGLGIYSGYYHMSAVKVEAGQVVQPGQMLGEVGTSGLSTGNHLHWDLLVAETWVDASAWTEQNMACWILEGLGERCQQ